MTDLDPAFVMAAHKRDADDRCHVCEPLSIVLWPCEPYRLAEALAASEKSVASWRASHTECERQYGQLLDEFNALADQPGQAS